MSKKPIKLSYSAASRFKQCPQKYYHSTKYYSTEKAAALPFGSAFEEGVTAAIETGDIPKAIKVFELYWTNEKNNARFPVYGNPEYSYSSGDYDQNIAERVSSEIEEFFQEAKLEYPSWQEAFSALSASYLAKEPLKDNELLFVIRTFWRSCLERGTIMLETFASELLPQIESVVLIDGKPGIQVPISIKNENGDEIMGYIDYVLRLKGHDLPVIVDCKTASIRYQEHDINTSEQLRTYCKILQDKIGPSKAAYMVIGKRIKFERMCLPCKAPHSPQSKKCKTCKEPLTKFPSASTQLMVTQYSEELLDLVLEDYDNILDSIVNEVNFRNTQSCRLYNRPCEFYDVCWKNKSPEEVEHLKAKKGYK